MNTTYTKLYQLQTNVCQTLQQTSTHFYLTGGTALARCFLHHRVSVDLDFFLNQAEDFSKQTELAIAPLQNSFQIKIQVKTPDFVSLTVEEELKVDFVNDIAHFWGDLQSFALFERVDNPKNILANKITAVMAREEPKDIVDIVAIAHTQVVEWEEVFSHANSKAAGILPPLVCEKIESMPLALLNSILWEDSWKKFADEFELHRQKVIADILRIKPAT